MTTMRTHKSRAGRESTLFAWQATRVAIGNAWRYAADFGRFAISWLGAYVIVAGILLLAWAFST